MTDNDKTLKAIAKTLEAIKDEMVKQTAIWKQINDKTHSWNIPNPDGFDDDIDEDEEDDHNDDDIDEDEEDDHNDDDLPEMGDTTEETN